MRIKSEKNKDIKLNMTAMIDIVFQLLVFFIMTFKIVEMEGDFNIKMPRATDEQNQVDIDVTPNIISVILTAGAEGGIAGIQVDNGIDGAEFTEADMYQKLSEFVEQTLSVDSDPSTATETEVEFDIEFNLKYQYTVRAIEAVSGRENPDGSVKKLIEKIKFKDNTDQGGFDEDG